MHTILLPSDPSLNFRFSLSIIVFSGFILILEQDSGGGKREREGCHDGTVGVAGQGGAQEQAREL
jgi:hypothetical protein